MTRYYHRAYGLSISSEVRLWPDASAPMDTECDVEILVCKERDSIPAGFSLSSADTSTRIYGGADLRVIGGRRVEVTPASGADDATVAACAGGAGLAMLLHQRGHFVLHASCVSIGGVGVCIAGPSGVGKSTLLVALAGRGHEFVSDGMTVLTTEPTGPPTALPGPSWAKLWPDSVEYFGWPVDGLARVTPRHDKRIAPVEGTTSSVSVSRVLVLSPDLTTEVAAMGPRDGLMAMMRNAFLSEYVGPDSATILLQRAALLVERLRVGRLTRREGLSETRAVVRLVEQLMRADVASPHGSTPAVIE